MFDTHTEDFGRLSHIWETWFMYLFYVFFFPFLKLYLVSGYTYKGKQDRKKTGNLCKFFKTENKQPYTNKHLLYERTNWASFNFADSSNDWFLTKRNYKEAFVEKMVHIFNLKKGINRSLFYYCSFGQGSLHHKFFGPLFPEFPFGCSQFRGHQSSMLHTGGIWKWTSWTVDISTTTNPLGRRSRRAHKYTCIYVFYPCKSHPVLIRTGVVSL